MSTKEITKSEQKEKAVKGWPFCRRLWKPNMQGWNSSLTD